MNKLLEAAAIAALTLVIVPTQAVELGAPCSGPSLGKTESAVEAMTGQ